MACVPNISGKASGNIPIKRWHGVLCLGFPQRLPGPIAGLGSGLNKVSGEMLWVLGLFMLGKGSFSKVYEGSRHMKPFGTHFYIDAQNQRIKKLRVYLL